MYTEDVIKKIYAESKKIDDGVLSEVLNPFVFGASRKETLNLVKYCIATEMIFKTYTIKLISKISGRKNSSSMRNLLHRLGSYGVVDVLRGKSLRYRLSEEFKKSYHETVNTYKTRINDIK